MTPEELSGRFLELAILIGRLCDALPDNRFGRLVAGQLIRSGTAPGPNYEEACASESTKDFVHKLSICLKELKESGYWLRLIRRAEMATDRTVEPIYDECSQLTRIVAKSIVTARHRLRPNR